VYFLFIVGPLFGYSAAAEFVLGSVTEAGYSASAFQVFAVFVLMSLGAEIVISSTLKTQWVVLGGSLIGVATALCAIGPGIPLVIWLIPILPSATTIATFVPTFAGALAAWRIAGDAFEKAGTNGPPLVRACLAVSVQSGAIAQQFADPAFDATVERPAFTDRRPLVLVDEAHHNFHTAGGRYRPFAELIKNDGYDVAPNTKKFTADALKGCAILVVANAQGAPAMRSPEASNPAFEPTECDAVHNWVRAGGSLLLGLPWG
jgi:hypothetical protein